MFKANIARTAVWMKTGATQAGLVMLSMYPPVESRPEWSGAASGNAAWHTHSMYHERHDRQGSGGVFFNFVITHYQPA